MISICKWLLTKEWDKSAGSLEVRDEVTVNGEMAGEAVNVDSFWGKVVDVLRNDYKIEDEKGGVLDGTFPRAVL